MKGSTVGLALVTFVVVAAVSCAILMMAFHGNITGFFKIGEQFGVSQLVHQPALQYEGSGYDGQFYVAMALDPFLRSPSTTASLDVPRYRYKRIGFPLAGNLVALGQARLVPYALVLLDVLSVVGLALIAAGFRRTPVASGLTPSPLWVLAIPGVWVSLGLSTPDLFATMLFFAGLLMLAREQSVPAAVLLSAAVLTRETYSAAVLLLVAFMFVSHRRRTAAILSVGLVPPLLWFGFVYMRLTEGMGGETRDFTFPLLGIVQRAGLLVRGAALPSHRSDVWIFAVLLLSAGFLIVSIITSRERLTVLHVAAVAPLAILTVVSANGPLIDFNAYLRTFMDVWMCMILLPTVGRLNWLRNGLLVASAVASALMVRGFLLG